MLDHTPHCAFKFSRRLIWARPSTSVKGFQGPSIRSGAEVLKKEGSKVDKAMDLAIDDANQGHLTEFRGFKYLGPHMTLSGCGGCLEKGTKPNKLE